MATATSAFFTGSSGFSQDLQSVASRAVDIASLPMMQMKSDLAALQDQQKAMSGLDMKFAALQAAVAGVSSALGGSSYMAEVSDESLVGATVTDGAVEGIYSIKVLDAGAYTTAMTSSAWKPSEGLHKYQVQIGNAKYDLSPANNNAEAVAAAINAKVGDKVRAIAMNVSNSDTPEYRISLQATSLGNTAVAILDNGVAVPQDQTLGSSASYIVNNSGKTVTSNSRSVAVANGLTLTLKAGNPNKTVNVTLTRSTSALSEALQAFATAYNDTVAALDAQQADAGGALSGQSLVRTLQQSLASLATYQSDSGFSGITELGFDLSKEGTLTFNPLLLMSADIRNSAGVTAFFGSATGGGFLKFASAALDGVESAASGTLKLAESATAAQITDTNGQIADQQAQVDQLHQQLLEKLSAADAAISTMEQQYSYLSSMFQAMQNASQQYGG